MRLHQTYITPTSAPKLTPEYTNPRSVIELSDKWVVCGEWMVQNLIPNSDSLDSQIFKSQTDTSVKLYSMYKFG